ncbi:MAG: hypothetical protein E7394_04635 [Ruminococcaceae bacterium]|nr:hypothetical protein [Oscillospiraceae bacterium]
MDRKCMYCAAILDEHMVFCYECGRQQITENNIIKPEVTEPIMKKKKSPITKWIIMGVISVIIILSILAAWFIIPRTGYRKVVRRFTQAIEECNISIIEDDISEHYGNMIWTFGYEMEEDEAIERVEDYLDLVEDAYEENIKCEKTYVYHWTKHGVEKRIEEVEREYNHDADNVSDIKNVELKISGKGHDDTYVNLFLSKEDGEWKILDMTFELNPDEY